MRTLLPLATALALSTAVQAADEPLPTLIDAEAEFSRVAADPTRRCHDTRLLLPVDTTPGDGLDASFDARSGRLRILYRMAFNQLTEGWNWHPEAASQGEDYYRFKYLPLKSVVEERQGYRGEDKIGEQQQMSVRWRYDYFFAFENLYDFYPRSIDDDAGFAAEVQVAGADAERLLRGDLRMALRGRLAANCIADSTTFWKAIYSRPVDFTLKKRYLIGTLNEVIFFDDATRKILAILPGRK